jgi:hypothetical protein
MEGEIAWGRQLSGLQSLRAHLKKWLDAYGPHRESTRRLRKPDLLRFAVDEGHPSDAAVGSGAYTRLIFRVTEGNCQSFKGETDEQPR